MKILWAWRACIKSTFHPHEGGAMGGGMDGGGVRGKGGEGLCGCMGWPPTHP